MPRREKEKQLSVSIVGAGRLGSALALALESAGFSVEAVVAQHPSKARRTARLLGRDTLALGGKDLGRLPASDLILISTPDDEISGVAERLANYNLGKNSGGVYLHTSGALSSTALSALAAQRHHVGSLHPLIAVTEPSAGAQSLRGAFWCVEGDPAAIRAGREIVKRLDGQSFSIKANKKPLYHAAAVMVSGHTVALFDLAIGMLMKSGLSHKRAREILLPLIESNVQNLAEIEPDEALTGSFVRGDTATIERHLRALIISKERDALAAYRILGKHSLQLASAANKLDERAVKKIMKLLAGEEDEVTAKRLRNTSQGSHRLQTAPKAR